MRRIVPMRRGVEGGNGPGSGRLALGLELAGLAAVIAGASLVWPPLGLVVGGGVLVLLAHGVAPEG